MEIYLKLSYTNESVQIERWIRFVNNFVVFCKIKFWTYFVFKAEN